MRAKRIRLGEVAVGVAVGLGAELGRQVLGAPGQARSGAGSSPRRCRRGTGRLRSRSPAPGSRCCRRGARACASRTASLASRCVDRRAALRLRQQDRVRLAGDDAVEVVVGQAGVERVDAHEESRPLGLLRRPRAGSRGAIARAAGLRSSATESSRSTISASAPPVKRSCRASSRCRRERTDRSA